MSRYPNLKDNAVPYPKVLDFTHWLLDTSAIEKKIQITGRRKEEKEGRPKPNWNTGSQILKQVSLPSDTSINSAISSLNPQPKHTGQGSTGKNKLGPVVLICLSLQTECNLRAGIMYCLVCMFSIGRTHSRYSKFLEQMVELRDGKQLDFQA